MDGDVLIYDLDSTGFLGGFPFTAKSSENVESTTYGAATATTDCSNSLTGTSRNKSKRPSFMGCLTECRTTDYT